MQNLKVFYRITPFRRTPPFKITAGIISEISLKTDTKGILRHYLRYTSDKFLENTCEVTEGIFSRSSAIGNKEAKIVMSGINMLLQYDTMSYFQCYF